MIILILRIKMTITRYVYDFTRYKYAVLCQVRMVNTVMIALVIFSDHVTIVIAISHHSYTVIHNILLTLCLCVSVRMCVFVCTVIRTSVPNPKRHPVKQADSHTDQSVRWFRPSVCLGSSVW